MSACCRERTGNLKYWKSLSNLKQQYCSENPFYTQAIPLTPPQLHLSWTGFSLLPYWPWQDSLTLHHCPPALRLGPGNLIFFHPNSPISHQPSLPKGSHPCFNLPPLPLHFPVPVGNAKRKNVVPPYKIQVIAKMCHFPFSPHAAAPSGSLDFAHSLISPRLTSVSDRVMWLGFNNKYVPHQSWPWPCLHSLTGLRIFWSDQMFSVVCLSDLFFGDFLLANQKGKTCQK